MNMDGERTEENSRQQKPPGSQMAAVHGQHQPPPHLKCPRCDSSNTKFCYYNNYSLSQPRYFCKACRRYWTQGGTLRNVPVGGGCRRAKRSKTSSSSSQIARSSTTQPLPSQSTISGQSRPQLPGAAPPTGSSLYAGGGFMSSLAAMQSLRGQGSAAMNLGGQFGANMALLQGISFPPSKTPAAAYHQFQPQNYFFPSQQSFIQARPFSSWTQSLIDTGGNANSNFWGSSGAAGDGSEQAAAGSSASPNPWSDNHPGFNHIPSDQ